MRAKIISFLLASFLLGAPCAMFAEEVEIPLTVLGETKVILQ